MSVEVKKTSVFFTEIIVTGKVVTVRDDGWIEVEAFGERGCWSQSWRNRILGSQSQDPRKDHSNFTRRRDCQGPSRLLKNSRRNCPEKGVTEIK